MLQLYFCGPGELVVCSSVSHPIIENMHSQVVSIVKVVALNTTCCKEMNTCITQHIVPSSVHTSGNNTSETAKISTVNVSGTKSHCFINAQNIEPARLTASNNNLAISGSIDPTLKSNIYVDAPIDVGDNGFLVSISPERLEEQAIVSNEELDIFADIFGPSRSAYLSILWSRVSPVFIFGTMCVC